MKEGQRMRHIWEGVKEGQRMRHIWEGVAERFGDSAKKRVGERV